MSDNKIYGVGDFSVHSAQGEVTIINLELVAHPDYNAHHLKYEKWYDLFPGNVIVKCQFCGQWGATQTSCKSCGGAID
jgi:glyceraldehyde-3-phosphate dehydrogenase/erythrose-4-phosphate dehydrogenase